MELSDNEKSIVIKQFDSLCKKSLVNVAHSYHKRQLLIYNRIIPNQYLENYITNDKYFKRKFIFYVQGIPVIIENNYIAKSLIKLKSDRRKIVLLYYFAGYSDYEISCILDIPRATIQYNRVKALKEMRKMLKRGAA